MTGPLRAAALAGALVLFLFVPRPGRAATVSNDAASVSDAAFIVVLDAAAEPALRQHGGAVWGRGSGLVLASVDQPVVAALAAEGITPRATAPDRGEWIYLLDHRSEWTPPPPPPGAFALRVGPAEQVWFFQAGAPVDLPAVRPMGAFRGIPRIPLPPIVVHPADAGPSGAPVRSPDTPPNPLVQQIVNDTSQPAWLQYVKDLSGENSVVIDGQTWTISTRYSDAMFPTPAANAHATEYLLDKAAGWGYTGVRESYTSAESGCGGQTKAWQNVIFTLPGQVDFGGHQQVLFVNHYDSLSFSTTESNSYAPGADDAISGGTALVEALRLFRSYGFRNTVKIAFYSGEEEGICGSTAYTRQHPALDMWRVVNMDQTAYDGDHNRLMNCYNWDGTNSPASVALGDFFVQANSDYGTIIDPAKIVRDGSKMCQTDHCPFWDVGVGAIALLEDLHNNDICPCFDQSQTPTCHDTVTQIFNGERMFTEEFSWPTQKAAIAAIAALAEPLYACPGSAPAVTLAPRNHAMQLSWTAAAGVTDTVIERATSCAGPFTPIATTKATSWEDTGLVNGTSAAYRLRTCPTQTGACAAAAPAAGPGVIYQAGSATVTDDSVDHDGNPDNCELTTVRVTLVNDGNVPLTNVRLASVSSTHPAARVATALPQVAGSLAPGATAAVSFAFWLGRDGTSAACGEALPFDVTAVSDQSPAETRSFTLTAEHTPLAGPLTYGFEGNLSGWTVTNGVFSVVAGGATGSTVASLHSRNINNDCDAVESPSLVPSATGSLTMWVNYGIQSGSADRTLVRAIDTRTGAKTLLTPTVTPYTTSGEANLLCDNVGNLKGWSGNSTTWRPASFDLSGFAGVPIQIEARYSTDQSALGSKGFWMDLVTVSEATEIDCDAATNTCPALPAEVSPVGAAVPFTVQKSGPGFQLRFSESAGASTYSVYPGTLASLHAGIYDHAASGALCGFTDAAPGDGQVVVTVAAPAIPDGSYLLAVAKSPPTGESDYGTDSQGRRVPIALSRCP